MDLNFIIGLIMAGLLWGGIEFIEFIFTDVLK